LPDYKPTFPQWAGKSLERTVNGMDAKGLDLLKSMLKYEPKQRISAKQALEHPYFDDLNKADYAQPVQN